MKYKHRFLFKIVILTFLINIIFINIFNKFKNLLNYKIFNSVLMCYILNILYLLYKFFLKKCY